MEQEFSRPYAVVPDAAADTVAYAVTEVYRPLRVLFVLSTGTADGGAAQVWISLLRGLTKYGVDPFVVLPNNGDGTMVAELEKLGIPYLELFYTWWTTKDGHPHSLKRRLMRRGAHVANARAEADFADALAEVSPDLVYLADGTITLGLDAAEAAGIPVVWQFHQFIRGVQDGMAFIDPDAEVSRQLKRAARIVTVNEGQRLDLCRRFGLDPACVKTVYNSVGAGRTASKVTLLAGDGAVFTLAGRIDANKRQTDALEAFERIAADYPDARLVFVGAGADADVGALAQRMEHSEFAEQVEYLGFRRDMQRVWNATDVALNCSMSEGCSMVVMEAMASGCLVLASTAEGNVELLDPDSSVPGMYEGVRGLLYRKGDVEDLAAQMRWILEHRHAARSIAAVGRADARDAFSPERQLRLVRSVFDEALGEL